MTGNSPIQRVLLGEDGKHHFVKDISKEYHCLLGIVSVESLQKTSGKIKTNKDKEFSIFAPTFIDTFNKLKQKPQGMSAKEIGFLIATLGLNRESVVIEAGSGSGRLTCMLASIVKKVVSYDIKEEFSALAKNNAEILGLSNIDFIIGDITQEIKPIKADAVILDMLKPWEVIHQAEKVLDTGGWLVAYSTNITQVMQFVEALGENFSHIATSELIKRDWHVEGFRVRPYSLQTAHTGFVTVVRKTT